MQRRTLSLTSRSEIIQAMIRDCPAGWMARWAADAPEEAWEILGLYHLPDPAIVAVLTRPARRTRPQRTFYIAYWLDGDEPRVRAAERLDESLYAGDAQGDPGVVNGDRPERHRA